MWTFEPHVATKVYDDMLRETKVQVVLGEQLDLKTGVKKDGARIMEIVMESGRRFPGKVFIDALEESLTAFLRPFWSDARRIFSLVLHPWLHDQTNDSSGPVMLI